MPEREETPLLEHVGRKEPNFFNPVGCRRVCGVGGRGPLGRSKFGPRVSTGLLRLDRNSVVVQPPRRERHT